jgi:hypothetical protein
LSTASISKIIESISVGFEGALRRAGRPIRQGKKRRDERLLLHFLPLGLYVGPSSNRLWMSCLKTNGCRGYHMHLLFSPSRAELDSSAPTPKRPLASSAPLLIVGRIL